MSKGLEALKQAKERNGLPLGCNFAPITEDEITIIEKELKALEIIKEKEIDMSDLIHATDYLDYSDGRCKKYWITQEEYDLLKEVLL